MRESEIDMTITILNLENVSDEVAIWIKQANDLHYYIHRLPKKQGSTADNFKISYEFKEKLLKMSNENAWIAVERHLGVAQC